MAKRIFRTSRSSHTLLDVLPKSLHPSRSQPQPSDYISVKDLADLLRVEPERLRPLIERHYLKMLEVRDYLEDCQVGRPGPEALEWLRRMFLPLRMRPLLPSDMAAELLVVKLHDFRRLCLLYGATLHDDPVFGELIDMKDFYKLFHQIHGNRKACRFDRIAMLTMMKVTNEEHNPGLYVGKLLPYSATLEREMMRIAHLDEPDRTIRATTLYNAYRDATTVRECIAAYHGQLASPHPNVAKRMKQLMEKVYKNNKNGDPAKGRHVTE